MLRACIWCDEGLLQDHDGLLRCGNCGSPSSLPGVNEGERPLVLGGQGHSAKDVITSGEMLLWLAVSVVIVGTFFTLAWVFRD